MTLLESRIEKIEKKAGIRIEQLEGIIVQFIDRDGKDTGRLVFNLKDGTRTREGVDNEPYEENKNT